uniref:Cleavage stimulation factor, 3' pre-RNA, subunit 2 n=1 Tax=Callorhinchus milii TaxID=7868 RepID=A0A4W3GWR3_CALMI
SEVGPVLSFRLVYDRETGKPKGYGFCEYQDQETALSAMRNLNGREFNGRALRVDNAASEKNKEELKNLGTAGPVMESPYGDAVSPEDAPESISRAVASLPPEQMFELMKQMKLCIQNSPQEARNMLLQNPQLAYALLQAQVVMRIVDPEIAMVSPRFVQKIDPCTATSGFVESYGVVVSTLVLQLKSYCATGYVLLLTLLPKCLIIGSASTGSFVKGRCHLIWKVAHSSSFSKLFSGSRDPRGIDTRGPGPGPAQGPAPNPRGPMAGALQGPGPHPMGNSGPQGPQQPVPPRPGPAHPVAGGQAGGFSPAQTQVTPQDHEKAALIMQVLQLTPEQIAMLPPEQRQSILILKEQIQKSAGAP